MFGGGGSRHFPRENVCDVKSQRLVRILSHPRLPILSERVAERIENSHDGGREEKEGGMLRRTEFATNTASCSCSFANAVLEKHPCALEQLMCDRYSTKRLGHFGLSPVKMVSHAKAEWPVDDCARGGHSTMPPKHTGVLDCYPRIIEILLNFQRGVQRRSARARC